jgi:hypothetical protein
MIQVWDHVVSVLRLTAFDQSQADHSGQEYDVRRQVDIKQENNKYISSQQVGHLKSYADAERGIGSKYHHHRITYKEEGNSLNSWKPIQGHKITDSFQSRYKRTTSNPLNSGEATHKRPTLIVSQVHDASELTRHQVLDNVKVNSADNGQLSPSGKEELYSKGKDSKWEKQSKSDSEDDTENKHLRHNNFASGAINLAVPANEQVKDEPLHISLYHSTNDPQALHQKNTNPIYNQKQNFAAPKHRPSNGKGSYNRDKYDVRKKLEEGLPNRFSQRIHNENENAVNSAGTEDMFNKVNDPDKREIHRETGLNDDNGDWEHGFEDAVADNEEMESNPYDTIHNRQNPFAYEYMPQDFRDEEELKDNRHVYDKDGGDENYDTTYDYAHKIQDTLKSGGSNIGRQAICQHKDDGVQRNLNQAKIKDGTRYYKRGSSSTSSENGTEDDKETEYIIQSRTEHLKDRLKRKMASNMDQN